MAWLILFVSGLFECGWAIGLKYSDGFTKPVPAVVTAVCLVLSFGGLTVALRTLPVGTAYAVWTGIGAACTAALGIYLFREPATPLRLASIGLVIAGIAGLKLAP